jgi:uncharacterized integral membrane protein
MKASTLIVLALATAAAASVAVANRQDVTFKLVPFVQDDSAFTMVTPLYLLVFFTFLLGVLISTATIGLRQLLNARRTRRAAKDAEKRLALDAAKARAK